AWNADELPSLTEFLPSAAADVRRRLLEELVKLDLEFRWSQSIEPLHLEDYVRRYPELGPVEGLPLDLIVEEYEVRKESGCSPSHDDFATRFPAHASALQDALSDVDAELANEAARERRKSATEQSPATNLEMPGAPETAGEASFPIRLVRQVPLVQIL